MRGHSCNIPPVHQVGALAAAAFWSQIVPPKCKALGTLYKYRCKVSQTFMMFGWGTGHATIGKALQTSDLQKLVATNAQRDHACKQHSSDLAMQTKLQTTKKSNLSGKQHQVQHNLLRFCKLKPPTKHYAIIQFQSTCQRHACETKSITTKIHLHKCIFARNEKPSRSHPSSCHFLL